LQLVVEGVLTISDLVEKMHTHPAAIIGIQNGLKIGSLADITIIDTEIMHEINSDNFLSISRNMPFNGMQLKGKAVFTMAQGKVAYTDDSLI